MPKSALSHDAGALLDALAGCLKIAHHIPGRIRLKLESLPSGSVLALPALAERFKDALASHPAIRGVAVNPLARSCVVEYNPALLPGSVWSDLTAGTNSAALHAFLGEIAAFGGNAASANKRADVTKETP